MAQCGVLWLRRDANPQWRSGAHVQLFVCSDTCPRVGHPAPGGGVASGRPVVLKKRTAAAIIAATQAAAAKRDDTVGAWHERAYPVFPYCWDATRELAAEGADYAKIARGLLGGGQIVRPTEYALLCDLCGGSANRADGDFLHGATVFEAAPDCHGRVALVVDGADWSAPLTAHLLRRGVKTGCQVSPCHDRRGAPREIPATTADAVGKGGGWMVRASRRHSAIAGPFEVHVQPDGTIAGYIHCWGGCGEQCDCCPIPFKHLSAGRIRADDDDTVSIAIHGLAFHPTPAVVAKHNLVGGRQFVAGIAAAAADRQWRWAQGIVCHDRAAVSKEGVVEWAVADAIRKRYGGADEKQRSAAPTKLRAWTAAAGVGISMWDEKGRLLPPAKWRERKDEWTRLLTKAGRFGRIPPCVDRQVGGINAVVCTGRDQCGVDEADCTTTPANVWKTAGRAPPCMRARGVGKSHAERLDMQAIVWTAYEYCLPNQPPTGGGL